MEAGWQRLYCRGAADDDDEEEEETDDVEDGDEEEEEGDGEDALETVLQDLEDVEETIRGWARMEDEEEEEEEEEEW